MSSTTLRRPTALLAAVVALALGACGGEDGPDAPPSGDRAGFPTTVDLGAGAVRIEERPEKVVSISPAVTEMLFAAGAGEQVVAVDDQSNFPARAPRTKLSGYKPSAEAIAGYDPDLVLLTTDADGIVGALKRLRIPTLVVPAPKTVDDALQQQVRIGEATGHADEGRRVADRVRNRIDTAIARVKDRVRGWGIYHELDQSYFSITSGTFLGDLYRRFGLRNVADGVKGASGDYPQLSREAVLDEAPEVVVLADGRCCGQTPEKVARRPGWSGLPAVREGRVVAIDDDIASRWGPRLADVAEQLAGVLGREGGRR